jgi:putative transposase
LELAIAQKRELSAMLRADYPLSVICQVLNLPRSTLYYTAQPASETAEQQAISSVVEQFPTYGSRRVAAQLRRAPYRLLVNRKRVRRMMRELGLLRPQQPRTRRTTNSQHPFGRFPNLVAERVATAPDQIWVSDITYIRLGDGFIYLAIILDVCTRNIRGWHLSRTLAQELTISALCQALEHARPQIHHSDQGIQYAAPQYIQLLRTAGVQISMATVGEPTQNGYAERVIRTIKEEEVALTEYRDFADARAQIGRFIDDVYRTKRIHSALGYLTPAEFEANWWQVHNGRGVSH